MWRFFKISRVVNYIWICMDLEVERRKGNKIGKLMVIIGYVVIKVKKMNIILLDFEFNGWRVGIIYFCVFSF